MTRFITGALLVLLSSCYAEWDIPRVPRRDPCTQVVEDRTVYIQPVCPTPTPRNPKDLDYQDPTYR